MTVCDRHSRPPSAIDNVASAWREIVGPDAASASRPVEVIGTALVVSVRSSLYSHYLAFLERDIVFAARNHGLDVERLRFRVEAVSA